MTKRKKLILAGLSLLLVGTAVFLFCYNQEGFTGRRVKIRTPICWTSSG